MSDGMTPINLMKLYGKRYRIEWDPAYDPKHRPRNLLDPWSIEILCQRGTIYPYDDRHLCVMIDHRPVTAKRVGQLPGVELIQDGDHEKTYRFPLEMFDQVAKLVKPRRKRQISDANKEAARQRMQAMWEKKKTPDHSHEAPTGV